MSEQPNLGDTTRICPVPTASPGGVLIGDAGFAFLGGTMEIKAIPQVYNGVRLRSKLEARWAAFFDDIGMNWLYEAEGVDLDGLWYLPDFWLPDCRTFFEVKGLWNDLDQEKVARLHRKALAENIMVAVGQSERRNLVVGSVRATPEDLLFGMTTPEGIPVINYRDTFLAICTACGKPWILTTEGSYQCRSCGEWDGDHQIGKVLLGHEAIQAVPLPRYD